jgi:hypothetical protein
MSSSSFRWPAASNSRRSGRRPSRASCSRVLLGLGRRCSRASSPTRRVQPSGQRNEEAHEASKRVVAQLLTLMDGFSPEQNVMVIAATNRPQDIDVSARPRGLTAGPWTLTHFAAARCLRSKSRWMPTTASGLAPSSRSSWGSCRTYRRCPPQSTVKGLPTPSLACACSMAFWLG